MSLSTKKLIEALVKAEVASLLERFRGFDLDYLKRLETPKLMRLYARKYLDRLGQGSSREVFRWKAGKVIKIVVRDDTLQNKEEVTQYINNPDLRHLLPRLYDYDKDNFRWIITQGAQVIQDNAHLQAKFGLFEHEHVLMDFVTSTMKGLSFDEALETAIETYNNENKPKSYGRVPTKNIDTKTLTPMDFELLKKLYEAVNLGVDDIDRFDHWGITADGQIVIVDYGIPL